MKTVLSTFCLFLSLASMVHAENIFKTEAIKEIICQSTFAYDEETPDIKVQARGIKIFTAGSRKDVKKAPGAFLLSEFNESDSGGLSEYGNQQFYFSPIHENKIKFEFIAEWKAFGELELKSDGGAVGFINQKSHITELSCKILLTSAFATNK